MNFAQKDPSYKTECMICHSVQKNPPLDIPIVGEPGQLVREFMSRLLMHIGKKHLTELAQGKALLDQYQAFLILSQFQSEDPSVQALLEGMRADIFRRTIRYRPTEADLDQLAAGCGFSTAADMKKARDAMQAIRDLCCEMGAAAPEQPEKQLVTP